MLRMSVQSESLLFFYDEEWYGSIFIMELLTGTVPVNNLLLAGTVSVNKLILAGTVHVNKFLLAGTHKKYKFQQISPPPQSTH